MPNDRKTYPVLHLHAQAAWHDEAVIVGNREALRGLLATIRKAIECGESDMEAFAADGEGYSVTVRVCDAPIDGDLWRDERLPYTAPEARER